MKIKHVNLPPEADTRTPPPKVIKEITPAFEKKTAMKI